VLLFTASPPLFPPFPPVEQFAYSARFAVKIIKNLRPFQGFEPKNSKTLGHFNDFNRDPQNPAPFQLLRTQILNLAAVRETNDVNVLNAKID
jgi:hypothetical protein